MIPTGRERRRPQQGWAPLAACVSAALALGGCAGSEPRPDDDAPPAATAAAQNGRSAETLSVDTTPRTRRRAHPPAEVPRPLRVRVPAVGIDTNLVPLSIGSRGRLRPPPYGVAGWWRGGPEPGEPGRAVIAGHVDSATGADVFYPLSTAERGDRVKVHVRGGKVLTFRVVRVRQVARADFPTEQVYGDSRRRELRLITCGGTYDSAAGHYLDNVIVFARIVRPSRPPAVDATDG